MYNMRYTGVLLDIKVLLKSIPESIELIETYGIKSFLDDCRSNDEMTLESIYESVDTQQDIDNYNYNFCTNFTKEELIKYLKDSYFVLPHADYKNFTELKYTLQQIHYYYPNIFQDLLTKPVAVIHNELVEKFSSKIEDNI